MLFRAEALVVEKDHEVVEERLADFRNRCVFERPCEVDPVDLRAKSAGNPANLERAIGHFFLPPSFVQAYTPVAHSIHPYFLGSRDLATCCGPPPAPFSNI
jgi:hypothetical protein